LEKRRSATASNLANTKNCSNFARSATKPESLKDLARTLDFLIGKNYKTKMLLFVFIFLFFCNKLPFIKSKEDTDQVLIAQTL
jgi:hypothetical protein